jgi:hypothetical protein
MDLVGREFENLECIHLGENRVESQSFMDMVINLL